MTEVQSNEARWESLATLPWINRPDAVWILNEHEFAISVEAPNNRNALYKYDSRANFWKTLLPVLREETGYYDKEIDVDNGRVFLLQESGEEMIIFDIESPRQYLYRISWVNQSERPPLGRMVNVNGSMHYVGCSDGVHTKYSTYTRKVLNKIGRKSHDVWNEKFLEWQPINTKAVPNVKSIDKLLHVASKNILLMIGTMKGTTQRCLWRFYIQSKRWELVLEFPLPSFGLTRVHGMLLSEVGIPFPCNEIGFSAILTSNEQFVIIAMQSTSSFRILDIRNDDDYKLRPSPIMYPVDNRGTLARTGRMRNTILATSGWIRRLKTSDEFMGMSSMSIPLVIERMIASWYSTEWIHWIFKAKSHAVIHQKIPLKDILNVKL